MELPKRVCVAELVCGRYQAGGRPLSWDQRRPGVETIKTEDGQEIDLYSSGGQSSPAPGWVLLLTREHEAGQPALEWTLYGLQSASH